MSSQSKNRDSLCQEVLKNIAQWFKEQGENPSFQELLKYRWEVQFIDDKALEAVLPLPQKPLEIVMYCNEENKYVRAWLRTGVETIAWTQEERLKLYHKLLKLSCFPLVKYMLFGDNDDIAIAIDLSIYSITKETLNHALRFLFTKLYELIKILGLETRYMADVIGRLLRILFSELVMLGPKEACRKLDNMYEWLIGLGYPGDIAKGLIQEITKTLNLRCEESRYIT